MFVPALSGADMPSLKVHVQYTCLQVARPVLDLVADFVSAAFFSYFAYALDFYARAAWEYKNGCVLTQNIAKHARTF